MPFVMATCIYCQREFVPSKYRWRVQKVCGDLGCRKQRQRDGLEAWRVRNPLYYKIKREDPSWRDLSCRRARVWRRRNMDRIRAYREAHLDQYRTYMRLYMRRYREVPQPEGAGSQQVVRTQPPPQGVATNGHAA